MPYPFQFRFPTETFNAGDIVCVTGRLYSGIARVLETCYLSPDNLPKGELSYGWHYDQPFPQLGITPMVPGAFERRTANIHYNGDDLVEPGKIRLATEDEKRAWEAWSEQQPKPSDEGWTNPDNMPTVDEWRAAVAAGTTMYGYSEWAADYDEWLQDQREEE